MSRNLCQNIHLRIKHMSFCFAKTYLKQNKDAMLAACLVNEITARLTFFCSRKKLHIALAFRKISLK